MSGDRWLIWRFKRSGFVGGEGRSLVDFCGEAIVILGVGRDDHSTPKTELYVRILNILVSTQYEKPVIKISF